MDRPAAQTSSVVGGRPRPVRAELAELLKLSCMGFDKGGLLRGRQQRPIPKDLRRGQVQEERRTADDENNT